MVSVNKFLFNVCASAIEEVDVRVIELSECVMHPTVIMSTRPDNPVIFFSVSVVVSCPHTALSVVHMSKLVKLPICLFLSSVKSVCKSTHRISTRHINSITVIQLIKLSDDDDGC